MTAGEFLERFRKDGYVLDTIRSHDATRRTYKPYFRGREVNQERTAFRDFWSRPNASLLKLHFEREYGVNVSSKRQMGAVLLALKLLFFEIREEVRAHEGICD